MNTHDRAVEGIDNLELLSNSELQLAFNRVKAAYNTKGAFSFSERKEKLKKMAILLDENRNAIINALSAYFGHRAIEETRISEIANTVANIDYAVSHLHKWMRPKLRSTSMWFLPGQNRVMPQALGVVGVMVPWNYPVNLAISPLAAALAAGNRCLIKVSELTPKTEVILRTILAQVFDDSEVVVVGGDATVAAEFASLPFDHLLFTGSTAIGKKVMSAAAHNLTPVTLELGGKNPVVIEEDYFLGEACHRILWGKTYNAGQTCAAPDYALIPKGAINDFRVWSSRHYRSLFPCGAMSMDYTSIINQSHFNRLQDLVDDARNKGAEILQLEDFTDQHRKHRKFPFTLIFNPSLDSKVMKEEIFGPILPIIEVNGLDEAIQFVNERSRPLAIYHFTDSTESKNKLAEKVVAGGMTVNDVMLQYLQPSQPFGGVGGSGFGAYHGEEGFKTFSHMKAIFSQRGFGSFTGIKLLYPPYGMLGRLIIKLMRG
ncbi:Coniferyl aldehyde dehydrogenase [Zhongshania aliphaticivorans]|uniref:Aldehyde dehydrogenase n=1 Tax=Zhongshania aliphaticivorans TaxID=1470434 RepID=A0A5S9PK48_9GAMM|nr:aldehyde dehydrogenase family protein [Zhongshania aliphaticivorans]CAA0104350.1 Coniferyl aldehyde dehydrogenase [Zhongshania aliphaticivorans]